MDNSDVSTSQDALSQNQPVNEQPAQPAPGEISHLAQLRAARQAQQGSAPAAAQNAPAGQPTPGGQETQGQQREGYIPRERFDEVHARMKAAEQRLAELQARMAMNPTGMQPVAPQQPAPMTMGGMVQPQAQASGQAVANSPQVQRLLDAVKDPNVREEWRKKISSNPVEGLAEFVVHALQTEGAALLQQALAPILAQLQPIQQSFIEQQLSSYISTRVQDPTWHQVEPVFRQLAVQAQANGYPLTPQNLAVIEAVARQQAGLPIFTVAAPAQQPPFTERPGSGGATLAAQPAPNLTQQELALARSFGMTPEEWAAEKAKMRRA